MSKWELAALCIGLYAAGAAASTVYLVSRGGNGKSTFDGFTGNESEGLKAAEAIVFWPFALGKALVQS